jgi:CheY-like chemotaxis protein
MSIPHILFIEDNPGDVTLMQEAFAQCWPGVHMHSVGSVAEGIRLLSGNSEGMPAPSMVLLDLNLPAEPGISLLEKMGAELSERRVPVVVFSSSSRQADIERSYRLGASLYVVKPNHWNGYADLASSFAKVAALSG